MRIPTALLVLLCPLLLVAQTPKASPRTIVEQISVTNDSLVSSEHLQQVEQEIRKQDYEDDAANEIARRAKYELQKDGYFKAETSTVDVQVLSESPFERSVSVTLRINEGQQYRLERITFKDNKVFPGSDLRHAFLISDGDVFDAEKIRKGLEGIHKMYGNRGYINFTPVPKTLANDQTRTINLIVAADEGAQFTVDSLVLSGRAEWPPEKAEKLLALWRPYAEHTYSPKLMEQIQQAMLEMFPGLDSDAALPAIRQNPKTKTVEIEVRLPRTIASN